MLGEYDLLNICDEFCNRCDHCIDYGGMDYAYGYPKYFEDWECEWGYNPSDEDCPFHEDYIDKCREEDDEEDPDYDYSV